MAQVDPVEVDGVDVGKPVGGGLGDKKRAPKRKRLGPCLNKPSAEEKQAKIAGFRKEIDSLVRYCKNLVSENRGTLLENLEKFVDYSTSMNGVIACLMDGSDLPLLKLVDEIFEKLKDRDGNGDGFTKARVKSSVLMLGQRLCYGVVCADADILEDESEYALWCWETRDLKLMPKSVRLSLKVLRTCLGKIQERIRAVLAMIAALEMSENLPNFQHELMKASDKLSKVLNEEDIRFLRENMSKENGAKMAEKEAERAEKHLSKQMEKCKREKERERKRIVREHQKEMLQSVRERKRMHGEAQREERRCEKEEIEMQKQLKRQQEQAKKDQRRREKEEAELRKQLVLQKQASLMERFLKRNKNSSSLQNDISERKETTSESSFIMLEPESVTLSMDTVMAQNNRIEVEDIWKSHVNAWRSNRCSTHSNRRRHWGMRLKPKTELVKELKLTAHREPTYHGDLDAEKLVVGLGDINNNRRSSQTNMDNCLGPCGMKKRVSVKLLQFDKSHRPAFYGVWPVKSQVVGPRHPFVKDSGIIYEIDSDEEWAEDEPGESLSDCDKDDEDESLGEHIKDAEEDENEDGFFVPDGYLSENEGVKAIDETEYHQLISEVWNLPASEQQLKNDEFCTLVRQQKYLNNLTEHALKKNHPMIILNLMHEKTTLSSPAEELSGILKLERLSLQTLGMRSLPGFPNTEISVPDDSVDKDQEILSIKSSTKPLATVLDSDLPPRIEKPVEHPHNLPRKLQQEKWNNHQRF